MNFGRNVETYMIIIGSLLSAIGSIYIIKFNWKQYGLLYFISVVVGNLLCYFFVSVHLYSFPYAVLPQITSMPFTLLLTMFPFYVLFGIRYSPKSWAWKIPFYWTLVHIGMFGEVMAECFTQIIKYESFWDAWDSYTWWWLFLLIFEVVGSLIVSEKYRRPIDEDKLRHGSLGWFAIHFILISTVFLGGFYMGRMTIK